MSLYIVPFIFYDILSVSIILTFFYYAGHAGNDYIHEPASDDAHAVHVFCHANSQQPMFRHVIYVSHVVS